MSPSCGDVQLLDPCLASVPLMFITVEYDEDPTEHHPSILTALILTNPSNKIEVYWGAWPRSLKAPPVSSSAAEKISPSQASSVLARPRSSAAMEAPLP
ncbi:unnamed protein product [Arabis nemorensis]|uniref:Uncharacterized protein n=1 Tax=Arabis nemorensis TaxID=586526 RepID=A0A565BST1_9BRAS|nr:unnamed protein product [Arabis nemorensis]